MSIFGIVGLNFCVRHGNRCTPYFIVTNIVKYAAFFQHTQKYIMYKFYAIFSIVIKFWLSPRSISTNQLNTLLHLHLWPINQLVFLESY